MKNVLISISLVFSFLMSSYYQGYQAGKKREQKELEIPIIQVELLKDQILLKSSRGEAFVTVTVDSLLREYQLVQEGTVFLCCENYCE